MWFSFNCSTQDQREKDVVKFFPDFWRVKPLQSVSEEELNGRGQCYTPPLPYMHIIFGEHYSAGQK